MFRRLTRVVLIVCTTTFMFGFQHPISAAETARTREEVVATISAMSADDQAKFRWYVDENFRRTVLAYLDAMYVAELDARANAGDHDAVRTLVWRVFGPVAPNMFPIIQRESGFNPHAKNPHSTASGLTQQLDIHAHRYTEHGWDWNTDRFDAYRNLVIAKQLYDESGLAPWRCC